MNHGRFTRSASALLVLAALHARAQQPAASAPPDATASESPSPAFRLTWSAPDHPSAIYHVKSDASLTLFADNTSDQPLDLSGDILFGPRTDGTFKPLSVTPIAAATLAPGQRVKIPLALSFAAAGSYELRFRQGASLMPIEGSNALRLQCIFAPRVSRDTPPWITLLPRAAVVTPGLLADYVQQTSVHRFLIDERFSYDPIANVGLGFGAASTASAKQVDALLVEAAKAQAQFTLRVAVPLDTSPATVIKSIDAFQKYIEDASHRSKGTLTALAIAPELPPGEVLTDVTRSLFRSYFLAGIDAARRADKNIALLGAGSAGLSAEIFRAPESRLPHLDALALSDASIEPLIAAQLLSDRKLPLQILPPAMPGAANPAAWPPTAAALATHAMVVPVPPPEIDNGVTAHLLGGSSFTQRIRLALPSKDSTLPSSTGIPFIAVFQGDGYAVAAIAGPSAGTDLDGLYPALARAKTTVQRAQAAEEPAYANLEVGDDTRAMRVVDAQGSPVDCRPGGGDNLYIPAQEKIFYLLQATTAEELAGTLRPAVPNLLPLFELSATRTDSSITIKIHNISAMPRAGQLRYFAPPSDPAAAPPQPALGEQDFPAIAPDQEIEITRDPGNAPPATLIAEVTTTGTNPLTQRSAIVVSTVHR